MNLTTRSLAIILSAAAILSGCTTLQGFLAHREAPTEPVLPPLQERPRLDPISRNYFVLESPQQSIVGEPQIVFTDADDTFSDLAREYGLGYDELVDANPGVDPWLPGEGTPVLLPTQYILPDVPRHGVVLNIAEKRLFYYPEAAEGGQATVFTYPIGIGRVGWETPLGAAKVIAKAVDPVWYVPWSVQQEHRKNGDPLPSMVPAGPDNPLGNRVLKLNLPGYLIHGTNKPYGVGMRVSHGCVRLYPEDIERLYTMVDVGTPVLIVDEPYLIGRLDGELYFESHPPLQGDPVTPAERLDKLFARARQQSGAFAGTKEQNMARTVASDALGVPIRVLLGDTFEVYTRARIVKNTVTPDPDAPTLAEVRALLEAPVADGGKASPVAAESRASGEAAMPPELKD